MALKYDRVLRQSIGTGQNPMIPMPASCNGQRAFGSRGCLSTSSLFEHTPQA